MSNTRVDSRTDVAVKPVGVMTVDDHEAFLEAAREVIDATSGFELVAEARSGTEALELAAEAAPDLILLDARMPEMDGYETARRLRAAHATAIIVLLSAEDLVETRRASSGATASLRKTAFSPAALRRMWKTHGSPRK